MVLELLSYRDIQKEEEIKKKTIDPNNYLKNTNINKISDNICYSNDPNIGLFLKDNPHLINYEKLSENYSDWASHFCLEYLYNNYDSEIDKYDFLDLIERLIKNYDNKIFTDKFCEFLYSNKIIDSFDFYQIPKNEKFYNFILNKIINEKDINLIRTNSKYILRFCNLDDLNLLKKVNTELFNNKNNYSTIYSNNNTEIVEYIISNLKFIYFDDSICDFGYNTNDLAAKYIIENILDNTLFLLVNENLSFAFINIIVQNPNDILVDYVLDKIKKGDRRFYRTTHLLNNSNDKVQNFIENNFI